MATTYFRKDGWVKSVIGPAVPGAQVYVCQQPANVSSLPPDPLADIFSDVNGLVPITQPIITDGFGHYDYYVAAGLYTEVIGLNNVIQQVYPDQYFGVGEAGPGNPYTAGSGISIVGSVISATGGGTVSSVAMSVPSEFSISGSPITSSGTLSLTKATQAANTVWAGPESGADAQPAFRALVAADISSLNYAMFTAVRGLIANPDATLFSNSLGTTAAAAIGTWSNSTPNATEAPSIKMLTSAIAGGQATVFNNNIGGIATGTLKWWQTKAAVNGGTTNTLWFAGISDVNPGTTFIQTPPTTQTVAGFYWAFGTLNYQCVACDGGGTASLVDSGVAVDTAFHLFQMFFTNSGATITYKIDGVTVATITNHVPTNTTQMGTQVTLQNANAQYHRVQYIWWSF